MSHHGPNVPAMSRRRSGGDGPVRRRVLEALALGLLLAVLVLMLATATAARAEQLVRTATGLNVTIHTPEDIADRWLVRRDGRTWLQHPTAGEVELETEAHPWDTLVPASAAVVADALRSIQGFRTGIVLDVFLLPGLPAEILGSFARRDAIFLAPGLGPQADETVAWLTTHEAGHVLCWAAIDRRPARWAAYRELRGLDPDAVDAELPHAERHREIIAEDLRALFGGPLATRSGTIENRHLPHPDAVAGLRDLLAGFLADPDARATVALLPSRAVPNPCRDRTTVELALGTAADKAIAAAPVLEIYDVRGRCVRTIAGGRVTGGQAAVRWDGTGEDGRRLADGVYLYRIRSGHEVGQGRVVLMRR